MEKLFDMILLALSNFTYQSPLLMTEIFFSFEFLCTVTMSFFLQRPGAVIAILSILLYHLVFGANTPEPKLPTFGDTMQILGAV
jgi:hypothetical protein